MPKVGIGKAAKDFAYNPAGKKAAKAYSLKTGKRMTRTK